MLRWLGNQKNERNCLRASDAIEEAVVSALSQKVMTPDLGGDQKTKDVGVWIAEKVRRL